MLYKVSVNQSILDLLSVRHVLMLSSRYHRDISIKIGDTVVFADDLEVYPYTTFMAGNALFSMGSFSYSRSELGGDAGRNNVQQVQVGRYCSIADNVRVFQGNHRMDAYTTSSFIYAFPGFRHETWHVRERAKEKGIERPAALALGDDDVCQTVRIGNDVWIGSHVALKPGIRIGDGSCIGTGALVTKDVPPYAIVAGVPAKVVKYRFDDSVIEQLLALRWWDYDFLDFAVHPEEPIDAFIKAVKEQVESNKILPYSSDPIRAKDILGLRSGT
ncbi:MAG: CatB-related O-acetyltransferase [Eggerthellaceae bacterium]|jgi:acetyltransferase-like isoleucine patch superfamily enzyme|nr:CatB-related O-acetyltransferase [Eggerthellaceae bacterium]